MNRPQFKEEIRITIGLLHRSIEVLAAIKLEVGQKFVVIGRPNRFTLLQRDANAFTIQARAVFLYRNDPDCGEYFQQVSPEPDINFRIEALQGFTLQSC